MTHWSLSTGSGVSHAPGLQNHRSERAAAGFTGARPVSCHRRSKHVADTPATVLLISFHWKPQAGW